jgi:galactose oxidase-like protein
VGYGQQFTVATPSPGQIGRVALVKAGSVTHSNNFDQRYVDLSYQPDGAGGLTATAPPGPNHAPPGWYMLFILSSAGVPSVASWVKVG